MLIRFSLLLSLAACTGCPKPGGVGAPNPSDSTLEFVLALGTAQDFALAYKTLAIEREDETGCWAWGAAHGALSTTLDVLVVARGEYPPLTIDLASCLTLSGAPEGFDVGFDVGLTQLVSSVVLSSAQRIIEFSTGWQENDCKTYEQAAAALDYLSGFLDALFGFLGDAIVAVPAVSIGTCPTDG